MSSIAAEILSKLDDLQNRYIAVLDGQDMKGWVATFSERKDATYICRSAENEKMGWPIALMLDDCRARIEDRITFVTQVWKGTFQEHRTRHFIQRLSCEKESETTFRMRTNFMIEYTMGANAASTLATGVYEDVVVIEKGEARFLTRRAVYDTTVLPQYVVYPF